MLPMYYDRVCSDESAELIEEHLKECPQCMQIFSALNAEIDISPKAVDDMRPLKEIQKKFKKTRLRWWISIATIILLIPVAFLGWNEFSARGVAYSNQDELVCGNAFMAALQEGNYEKAYSYLDIEEKKHVWLEDWFEAEDLVNMEEDGLKKFCQLGENLESLGGIETYEYVGTSASYGVNYRGDKVHQITYRIKFEGKDKQFIVNVSKGGISGIVGGGSFLTDPLAQFCIWSEYLWQDYQGCYYNPDLKEYVYYNKE